MLRALNRPRDGADGCEGKAFAFFGATGGGGGWSCGTSLRSAVTVAAPTAPFAQPQMPNSLVL